jgi:DNA topoisomerase-3
VALAGASRAAPERGALQASATPAATGEAPSVTSPPAPAGAGAGGGAIDGDADASWLRCPRCGQGTLVTGKRAWGCARWREGCRFVIWFEAAGKRITAAQLRELLTRGKTRKGRFAPGNGPPVQGRLVLDPSAAEGGARFVAG